MLYKLGETSIDVTVEKAEYEGTTKWKCEAFIGNSLFITADTPHSDDDNSKEVEFEFLRLVAWELSRTVTNILWGDNYSAVEDKERITNA